MYLFFSFFFTALNFTVSVCHFLVAIFQLPNDHLFAQIAEKALRGTFANSEITSGLADRKMHQQFSELLKQQFSILANRQKDALAGLGGANSLPDSENGVFYYLDSDY